jgi:hypothetical protein
MRTVFSYSQLNQYSQLAGYSPGPGGGFFNLPQLTSYLSKANGDRQIFKDKYLSFNTFISFLRFLHIPANKIASSWYH